MERVLEYVEKYYRNEFQLTKNKSIYDILPLDLHAIKNLIYKTHIVDILSFKKTYIELENNWEPNYYRYSSLTNHDINLIKKEATEITNNESLLKNYLSNYFFSTENETLLADIENLLKENIF